MAEGLDFGCYFRAIAADPGKPLLLSFDLEDYNQLVGRNLGLTGWDRRGGAFERQMAAVFGLLDEVSAHATFFLLGTTMRHYPEIVQEIAARGDEVACHGFEHRPVFEQGPDEFRRDISAGVELIEGLTGRPPAGYRAPAFSIRRDTVWALEILAELGFTYDSSQYDSPRIPGRLSPAPHAPHELRLPSGKTLWEVPLAVWRPGGLRVPIGGGSYWRILPARVLLAGLSSIYGEGGRPALYFHPYELDPQRLTLDLGDSPSPGQRRRSAQIGLISNPGRRRLANRIRAIASQYSLSSYERALAEIQTDGSGAGPRALSGSGELV